MNELSYTLLFCLWTNIALLGIVFACWRRKRSVSGRGGILWIAASVGIPLLLGSMQYILTELLGGLPHPNLWGFAVGSIFAFLFPHCLYYWLRPEMRRKFNILIYSFVMLGLSFSALMWLYLFAMASAGLLDTVSRFLHR